MILEEMADEAAAEKGSLSRSVAAAGQAALDRFVSFRITYVAVFAFLLLFMVTIRGTEALLQRQFSRDVARAVVVRSFDRPIAAQIELGVRQAVYQSRWLGIGGLRVSTQVFSRDGTLIFLNGRSLMPPSSGLDPASIMRESERLRPLSGSVSVSLPIGSLLSSAILVAYATVLLWTLFFYNKRVVSRENAILGEAQAARDATLRRTEEIEAELDTVRRRLREVEPAEREHAEEIR
ncbi:MAG: hypothetical protein O7A09_05295, partial [Proteobacteria bacterium]|nr:hypothetical protein [Pseudomonadota bacterium]